MTSHHFHLPSLIPPSGKGRASIAVISVVVSRGSAAASPRAWLALFRLGREGTDPAKRGRCAAARATVAGGAK